MKFMQHGFMRIPYRRKYSGKINPCKARVILAAFAGKYEADERVFGAVDNG